MTNWKACLLGDEIELAYGKALPEYVRKEGQIPVFGSNGVVGFHNTPLVSGPGIIVGRKGSVGEIAYSIKPFWPIDTSYYVVNKGKNNWKFIFYLLLNLGLSKLNRPSPVPGLNRQDAYSLEISLPPIDEQEKIADIIDHIAHSIELENRLIKSAITLRISMMKSLFTQGLLGEDQKETAIGLIPKNWNVCTLASIAKLERGRFMHRPRNEPRFYGGTTPFVQTGDIVRSSGRIRHFTQTLNDDGVAISRVFPAGTILITIAANIGYTGILEFDSACPDSLVAIQPNTSINVSFLEYFLRTQQPIMDRQAPKGTQKNINIQFLNPWLIPIPSLPEQLEIVSTLKIVDEKINLHNRKLVALNDLFKTLLHKLMTDEVRVNELDLLSIKRPAETVGDYP